MAVPSRGGQTYVGGAEHPLALRAELDGDAREGPGRSGGRLVGGGAHDGGGSVAPPPCFAASRLGLRVLLLFSSPVEGREGVWAAVVVVLLSEVGGDALRVPLFRGGGCAGPRRVPSDAPPTFKQSRVARESRRRYCRHGREQAEEVEEEDVS